MKYTLRTFSIAVILICGAVSSTFAQQRRPNSIYVEMAGVAGNYSVNYDRILGNINHWLHYSAGGGCSVWNNTVVNFPLHILMMAGPKSHNLELGLGGLPELYFSHYGNDQSFLLFYSFGYRYQKPDGKIRMNITVSPMSQPSIKWNTTAVGIGAGYVF